MEISNCENMKILPKQTCQFPTVASNAWHGARSLSLESTNDMPNGPLSWRATSLACSRGQGHGAGVYVLFFFLSHSL